MMLHLLKTLVFFVFAALTTQSAFAQFPIKPIKLLIGLPPGAVADINARIIAQAMSESLGQPVVVENKPGAEESFAIEAVRESPADGYTIGMFNFSSLVATPSLNKNVNFDPRKDLAPISMFGRMSVSLSVNPALPVKTLRELTEYALANPGKLNFASVGALDTLLARMLMKDSAITMTQVNYKGPVQSMQDVMAGVIQIGINPIGAHIELAKGGRVRMLTGLALNETWVPSMC